MNSEVIHLDELYIGGAVFFGDPFSQKGGWDGENEIGKTWARYMEFRNKNEEYLHLKGDGFCYEIHVYNEKVHETGIYEIFIGEAINDVKISYHMSVKYFPPLDYLKVTLRGHEIISDWWLKVDKEILPSLNLKRIHNFSMQRYDERFKGVDKIESSELEVLIPVEKVK